MGVLDKIDDGARALASGVEWAVRPSSSLTTGQMIQRLQQLRERNIMPPDLQLMQMREVAAIPDVPQLPIQRYQTTRPPSDVQLGFGNRVRTLLRDVERGMTKGAHEWYSNEPTRQQFIYELGSPGDQEYGRFADFVAATSSSAPVRENTRKGSWFRQQALEGLLPTGIDTQEHALEWLADHRPPKGYGSLATINDVLWASRYLSGDQSWRAMQPGSPHKILSFSHNLRGNLRPGTLDRHEGFALGVPMRMNRHGVMEKGALTPNEYVAAEPLYQRLADQIGIAPAQFQAARWIGGARRTGVRSAIDPTFNHAVEHLARERAAEMGETPEWVLRNFIRNGGLLAVPAAMAGTNSEEP